MGTAGLIKRMATLACSSRGLLRRAAGKARRCSRLGAAVQLTVRVLSRLQMCGCTAWRRGLGGLQVREDWRRIRTRLMFDSLSPGDLGYD